MSVVVKIKPDVVVMPVEDYESPELRIAIDDERLTYCPHEHVKIFEHHRRVICTNCGANLDAFDHLLSVGKKENGTLSSLTWLKHEVKRYTDQRDALKKEISNLKSTKKKII